MEEKKYTTGFTTPKNYFAELDDRLWKKVHETPLPEEHGFQVPDGYFTTLEDQILQKTRDANVSAAPKVIPLYKQKKFVFAASIAACFAIVFSIIDFTSETPITFNDINTESITSYIDEGNLDISSQEIAQLLQEEDVEALTLSSEEISAENLTDYLLNNIDDPTLLLE